MAGHSHDELMRRREQLLLRSSQLRADWSLQVQGLRTPLRLADRARDGVNWLVQNPQWPLGVLLLVVVLRPRRALRLASYVWQGMGALRRVQRMLGVVGAPLL
jgi:hypothetical protein